MVSMHLADRRTRRALRVSAWLVLALIAFATEGPLSLRPTTGLSPQLERLFAFALVGALFAAAYPRRIFLAAVVVLGAAVLLEMLQLLTSSRHGRVFDAGVKVAGGIAGLAAGWLFARLTRRR